jgi:hypothetical protein
MLDLPLHRVQRWMQAVVVHPGATEEALRSPEARGELDPARIDDLILPSRTLAPAERVAIYQGMYPMRMRDALASDYPGLEHFLGAERFGRLVSDYVQAHPSRSYTLNRLGAHLPEFVRTHADLGRREFCHDLARLELAVTQVFDAEETPALSEAQIAAVPPEAWERARLRPIAALGLLALRYPANAYLQSVRNEDHANHPRPRLKSEWVAIYRRDFAVYRLDLTRDAHGLLEDLADGQPLGRAVSAALARAARRKLDPDDLFRWFREWASGGLFRAVEV